MLGLVFYLFITSLNLCGKPSKLTELIFYSFFGVLTIAEAAFVNPIVFVILSQQNEYHENVANEKKASISSQLLTLKREQDKILIAPSDFNYELGYWIITSLFDRLIKMPRISWAVFLEEETEVNVSKLLEVLHEYENGKDHFIGHGLQDQQPTIIHHFDSTSADEALIYPDFSAGFVISFSVVIKGSEKWIELSEQSFSIDPKYELAKFIKKEVDGLELENDLRFCLKKKKECATWIQSDFPACKTVFTKENVMFAVKTCQKYHDSRVKVVKNTWAKELDLKITFFSDTEDLSIPTIDLQVENVDAGHCEKTMSIIRYLNRSSDPRLKWVVIVDDDTLISVPRLMKLLSCYNSSDHVALGERYGYGLLQTTGYDYITGGAGMVFSMPTVKLLANSCQCPSISSPDDMIIGICLKQNGVPIIHSNYFHQARPEDYSPEFLKHQESVSFHKHWMTDPYQIYKEWLSESKPGHNEL